MNAGDKEIVFTSGATESDDLAIFGVARAYRTRGDHVVTGATEHRAVLDTCGALEKEGFRVTFLQPDRFGTISAGQVEEAITDRTVLVTLMFGNNEIGTVHPLAAIGEVCRRRGVLFHTDAVQGFGKIPFDVERMKVDLASISGHKIYAPKGVGALYVRSRNPRVRLAPILVGGGQERGMRSGTLNVPGIVALGFAAQLAVRELESESRRLRLLRARLFDGIAAELPGVTLNGPPLPRLESDGSLPGSAEDLRLPGNLNCSFAGVEGEALVLGMKDIAVSSGSACTSASLQPSHVLRAVGVPDDLAHASIRFGLGRFTTEEEIDFAVSSVAGTVRRLRALSPAAAAPAARPAGNPAS
ncbi:MAG TPA: aminotransferase class V-fold PLP-dependent enzyme, partial [Thermoanaerobaculia bacterium]